MYWSDKMRIEARVPKHGAAWQNSISHRIDRENTPKDKVVELLVEAISQRHNVTTIEAMDVRKLVASMIYLKSPQARSALRGAVAALPGEFPKEDTTPVANDPYSAVFYSAVSLDNPAIIKAILKPRFLKKLDEETQWVAEAVVQGLELEPVMPTIADIVTGRFPPK
jgi:hypothetical protein